MSIRIFWSSLKKLALISFTRSYKLVSSWGKVFLFIYQTLVLIVDSVGSDAKKQKKTICKVKCTQRVHGTIFVARHGTISQVPLKS